jgi:hypothetical protein
VEDTGNDGERDGQEEGGAAQIGGDKGWSASVAVNSYADQEAEEEDGDAAGRAKESHLQRSRA